MKKRSAFLGAVLFLTAVFLLSACGASKQVSLPQAVAETEAAYDMSSIDPAEANAVQARSMAEESGQITGTAPVTSASGISLPQGRKLIRNVTLRVETDAFDQLIQSMNQKITELGGYVENSDISGSSLLEGNEKQPRYASMTVRIPSDKLDGFVTVVENSGNVTNKSENTSDVTLQYSDIESRKKSLQVEQDRMWTLLEKAESLDAVISLEQRLSEIRYELESMESQLRLYDNQVDYSSVYLQVQEVSAFTPTKPESAGSRIQKGFSDNLRSVTSAAVNFVIFVLAASPVWIPLLIVLTAVILLIRRHNKKTAKEKPEVDDK